MRIIGDGGLATQIKDVIDSFNCYSISARGRVQEAEITIIGFASLEHLEKREEAFNKYEKDIGTLIAPSATVSQDAYIDKGCVILHDAFVGPGTLLGLNVLVGTKAIIEHNSIIGNHSVVLTGAIVNGNCKIGRRCMIGSGAIIIQGIEICDDVKIGAGTVVIDNILESGIYVGNPSRRVK